MRTMRGCLGAGYLDSDEEYDEDNDDDYECLEEEDVDESEGEPYWRLP